MRNRLIAATAASLLTLMATAAGGASEAPIPTSAAVGPAAMPAEIEPIAAPFDMATPVRPEFAQRIVTLGEDGALAPDAPVTARLQRLIDETSAAGGGTVVAPAGKWHVGRLILRSHVNLHLAAGAELHFSGQIEDYLPPVFTRYEGLEIMGLGGLIYAHGAEHFAITGRGLLVGPESGPVREARRGLSDQLVDPASPVEDRVFDGQQGRHYFRPYFITLVDCRDALIEGVSLRRGVMWNIVPIMCDGVVVRGVTIDSRGVVNGDGVDVESSRNVLVEYCAVNTGDDCYVLKAGRNADGVRTGRPVENVVFRRNLATGGIGGVTCGSETAGGIRRVHVHDCVFDDVKYALYFKTRRPRGGGGEQLSVERVRFTARDHAIFFDMLGSTMFVGELANRLPPRELTPLTPYYRDVTIRQVVGQCGGYAVKVKGIPESPATRVEISGARITAAGALHLSDTSEFSLLDSAIKTQDPTCRLQNCRQTLLRRVTVAGAVGQLFSLTADAESMAGLLMQQCRPPRTQWRTAPIGRAP